MTIACQEKKGLVSLPRENVLLVPNRNVLLTGGRWECGGTRSSEHDPAGSRPAGDVKESAKAADQAAASRRGVGNRRAPGAAAAEAVAQRGRPGRNPRTARQAVEAANRCGPRQQIIEI